MPKKPVNLFKLATLPDWQQQRIKADESKAKAAQVHGSALKSFSSKRLAKLGSKTLYSTFAVKPGAKTLQRARVRNGHTVRTLRQKERYAIPRQPLRKRSRSESAIERRRKDAIWREDILRRWAGYGCIGALLGRCQGNMEAMHIRGKGAHPELRHDPSNGLPGCEWHHRLAPQNCQFYEPLTQALWAAGDLLRAAADGRRLPPSWEELQSEIQRTLVRAEREQRRRQKEA